MRVSKIILSLFVIAVLALGVIAYAAPSGSQESTVRTIGGGGSVKAGTANVTLQTIQITDNGSDGNPTDIEKVCVQAGPGTLPGRYIQQLKLYTGQPGVLAVLEDGGVGSTNEQDLELWLLGPFPHGLKGATIDLEIVTTDSSKDYFKNFTKGSKIGDTGDTSGAYDDSCAAPTSWTTNKPDHIQIWFWEGGGDFPKGTEKVDVGKVKVHHESAGPLTILVRIYHPDPSCSPSAPDFAVDLNGSTIPYENIHDGTGNLVYTPWAAYLEPSGDYHNGSRFPPLPISSGALMGIVRHPDFSAAEGVCFGRDGRLLLEVEDGGSATALVKADLRYDAPDGLTFKPITTFVADDGLLGGSAVSSAFTTTTPTTLGNVTTVQNATGEADAQVTYEDGATEAEPGAQNVVLGQFLIEDFGNRSTHNPTYLQGFALFLEGLRGGTSTPDVLDGINSISLYVERGNTGPGFQPNDRRLARVTYPMRRGEFVDLDGDGTAESLALILGRHGRTLMRIDDRKAARFYVVANLNTNFQNGDEIALKLIPGASDGRGWGNTSSKIYLTPGTLIDGGTVEISGPSPTVVIPSIVVGSTAKLVVSLKNIPAPGLDTFTATFVYNPAVADVAPDTLDEPKVRALGNYNVIASLGRDGLNVVVTLKPRRKAATGDFDLLEIEFEAMGSMGEQTDITVDPWTLDATTVGGSPLEMDIESGTIEVRLIKGDVNGDGIVSRADAREVALFIVGRSSLTWTVTKQLQADVAEPFCNPDYLVDNPPSAPVCIDASDVRAIMLAAYGLITLDKISALALQPLQVDSIALSKGAAGYTLAVEGQGVASVGLQLYSLSGGLVLDREAQGNTLQFQALDSSGQALANGVYLYTVTVKGWDGTTIKSEVRKLVILR